MDYRSKHYHPEYYSVLYLDPYNILIMTQIIAPMLKSKETIFAELDAYVQSYGGHFTDWYVGVSSQPEAEWTRHHVNPEVDPCISFTCSNAGVAKDLQDFLVNILRADGVAGSGGYECTHLYAYKKNNHTHE